MTTEQMKQVVDRLNAPPFGKKLNVIQLDNIDGIGMLQLLNDVLSAIDAEQDRDLRTENANDTAQRMFAFLRLLKYKPPVADDATPARWRENFILGDRPTVIEVLAWLLERWDMLGKRAYVGKYLAPLDIPSDMEMDAEVGDLHAQYLELAETFKDLNRQKDAIEQSSQQLAMLQNEIKDMSEEKQLLATQVERMKKRSANVQV